MTTNVLPALAASMSTGEGLHGDVAQMWWAHRVLPTRMRERLCQDPICGF